MTATASTKPAKITPMMAQFLETKEQYPDYLLFYRMGDFYELFFDDAVTASKTLDLTLTKRGKHNGEDIPMAGVPVHSHMSYLDRLIKAGYKVALCEQLESPAEARKRMGAKALVKRGVVRLYTKGTLTEETLLSANRANYLAAIAKTHQEYAVSWLDMSTGVFCTQPTTKQNLGATLTRLSPAEILLSDHLLEQPDLYETLADWKDCLSVQSSARYDYKSALDRLLTLYDVSSLDAFGTFSRAEITAAGVLISYVELTQKGKLPRFAPLQSLSLNARLEIDAATRRSLELTKTQTGDRKGSLLACLDETVTGSGARLLTDWLSAPLTDPEEIAARQDAISFMLTQQNARDLYRQQLKQCPDIERALSRLSLGRGGPRDLAAIRGGLEAAQHLATTLQQTTEDKPQALTDILQEFGEHSLLTTRLTRALEDDLPLFSRDGGFIREGYSEALDELRGLKDNSRKLIINLQQKYADLSDVSSLKIKHNNVLGYFIEVTARFGDQLRDREDKFFIHRQTLANNVRFTTVELSELEQKISSASEKTLALEEALFTDLVQEVLSRIDPIARTAYALAKMDVYTTLAEIAFTRRWVRPTVDTSLQFDIIGGRHPVVEQSLEQDGAAKFIANDCCLNPTDRLWLLTGPNMAGKSTFLRQNALIAVLAQMGSYVPAQQAHIGIIDKLFSRVGAADDLARGRSTFMVEMVETASILNQASPKSLVILDEIGRGTATFDGMSIAWACVEHLIQTNQSRGLFATHYHELTELEDRFSGVSCHRLQVKEWKGDIHFLHEVARGAADKSYGIHVARLAGLPKSVLKRAQSVLKSLEDHSIQQQEAPLLPLFADIPNVPEEEPVDKTALHPALEQLEGLALDDLSPRQALDALYHLKDLLDQGE